jgi:hypothetical protein
MIYLNDQMVGGETRFFGDIEEAFRQPPSPYLSVHPKAGMALVQTGQKYVLRTDILYGSHTNASRHTRRNVA